jgi:hypothetical protein
MMRAYVHAYTVISYSTNDRKMNALSGRLTSLFRKNQGSYGRHFTELDMILVISYGTRTSLDACAPKLEEA